MTEKATGFSPGEGPLQDTPQSIKFRAEPMPLHFQDFAAEYASRSNDDLQRLARNRNDLVPDARQALAAELSRRGLSGKEAPHKFEVLEEARQRKLALDPRKVWNQPAFGCGVRPYFRWNRARHEPTGKIEFTTTVFFVLFYLPIVPTGTWRVRAPRGSWRKSNLHVLTRLPLNWTQALLVWSITALLLLALITAIRLAPHPQSVSKHPRNSGVRPRP